ncbi:MAG: AsmA-like C-terminal region-containing protein, partial [Alphaproteobacteria bacterium]|nr:AsmA-like C-terminal region-containing protein [Alphaproteobacteria bacterium]
SGKSKATSGVAVPLIVLAALNAFDANIEASVDKLTYRKTTARKAHADFTLFGDEITVRDLSVADFAGVGARLTGALKGLRKTPTATFDFAARANDPARLFRFVGEKPPVPVKKLGKLAATGRIGGTLNALTLKGALDAAGGKISVDGVVKSPLGTPVYEVGVAVNHPELARFIRIVAPGYRPAAGTLGPLGVSFRALGGPGPIRLTELQGNAGPVRVSGAAELALSGKRPRLDLDLKTSEVLLDLFLPRETKPSPAAARVRSTRSGQPGAGRSGATATGRWSREPIVAPLPIFLDGDFTIEMSALTKDPYQLEAPRLHAVLQDGRLTVNRLTARIFGGALEAKATVDTGSGVPDISASFAVKNLDSRKTIKHLANLDRLKGPVSMTGNLRATGTSEAVIVSSLSGVLNLSGRVQIILKKEEQAAVGAANIANLASVFLGSKVRELRNFTPFAQLVVALDQTFGRNPALLSGDIQISKGVARTSNLTLGGSSGRAVTAATVDLPAWQLQSRTDLLDRSGGEPLLTYELSGPIDNPARTKLSGKLLKGGQGAVQQQVTDPLRRLLPGILGGKTSPQQPQGSTTESQQPQKVKPKDALRGVLKGLLGR